VAFQGIKPLRELNWEPFTHSGLQRFCPPDPTFRPLWLVAEVSWIKVSVEIYCSAPTKAIAKLILLDSAKIQEEEAEKLIKANIPNMKLRATL
jgi:metallo-beta-lactamase family protein